MAVRKASAQDGTTLHVLLLLGHGLGDGGLEDVVERVAGASQPVSSRILVVSGTRRRMSSKPTS